MNCCQILYASLLCLWRRETNNHLRLSHFLLLPLTTSSCKPSSTLPVLPGNFGYTVWQVQLNWTQTEKHPNPLSESLVQCDVLDKSGELITLLSSITLTYTIRYIFSYDTQIIMYDALSSVSQELDLTSLLSPSTPPLVAGHQNFWLLNRL